MGVFNIRQIVLDYIVIDTTLFDPAVSEIFYFKHDVGASNNTIFIGNPDVKTLALLAMPSQFQFNATPLLCYCIELFHCVLCNQYIFSRTDPSW